MRSKFDVNLMSQLSFHSECLAKVGHSSTPANYLLQMCDVNIRIAFAFAESMPRALQSNIQSVQVHLFVQHLQFNRLPLMEHFSFPLCFGLSFLMALLSFSSCPIIQKHWLIINHFSKPWLHQWYITWFGIEQKQID